MTGTSTQTISEHQTAKGTVGTPLNIILVGETNVPPPGPGSVQMESYDPAYLKVLQCGWFPQGELVEDAEAFQVVFLPLQAGFTKVDFLIRPRALNPLYQPVTFAVTITQ
jgi:hypothetical protein